MRAFHFLVNERARSGGAVALLQRLLVAQPLCRVPTSMATFVDDDGIRRGLDAAQAGAILVAVGGDGTLASVVRLMREAGREGQPLGVLPLGTGNGVAHSLGIGQLPLAVDALLIGSGRDYDVMTTTHPGAPLSLLSISVGLESLAMQDFDRWRRTSRLVGALAGGIRRSVGRVSGLLIEGDGQRLVSPDESICNAGLYNAPCYGFGVMPRPPADATDGLADLRVHRGRVGYAAYMAAGVLRMANPFARHPHWPRIQRAVISSPLPVQIDGETLPAATFEVEVLPRALQILAPSLI